VNLSRATGDYAIDRLRHVRAFQQALPSEEAKLTWPIEKLHALRDRRLRALLRDAKARSPWHARRLQDIDVDKLSGDDLSSIPPMTKADLIANWDEIVTDRRLTLEVANRHLERVASEGPAYLLDQYHVIASGGTSGQRTVFAWDFEGWLQARLVMARHEQSAARMVGGRGVQRLGIVAAPNPVHASGALFRTFGIAAGSFRSIPSTLPIAQIVAALNAYRPDALQTYPSSLRTLTHEAHEGRLHIQPKYIMCGGEPLTPEIRRSAEEAFRVAMIDVYACSETSWIAVSFPNAGAPLHLVEDAAVYEPVDAHYRQVAPGTPGNGLLVTNVVNRLLPLIRYELTDGVTLLHETNPGPWTGRRIAPVHGRQEQVFTYPGGIEINPEVFDVALDRVPAVLESQVEQLDNGAILRLRVGADANLRSLTEELRATLHAHGLSDADIRIERVDHRLDGTSGTGKLNRFVAHGPGHVSRTATS